MRQVVLEVTSSMLFQVLPCPPGHRTTVRTPPLHEPQYTTVSANNLEVLEALPQSVSVIGQAIVRYLIRVRGVLPSSSWNLLSRHRKQDSVSVP